MSLVKPMAQTAKLQLRQTQGLALTPQLMQSIKLLQMNAVDLNQYILSEIEKNPLLELGAASEEFPEDRRNHGGEERVSTEKETNQPTELIGELSHKGETQLSGPGSVSTIGGSESQQNIADIEAYIAQQQSLRDVLLQQATLSFRKQGDLKIAREIIDLIDSDGYIRSDLKKLNIARHFSEKKIANVLTRIQSFDPPGVGARNLAECMQLQLREKNRLDPAMLKFTQNLELLARRDYKSLADICGVSHEDLVDMAQEIQALEPRPGDAFNAPAVQNIVADVFVNLKADGSWHIELNSQTLPRVLINREYYAEIKELGLGKADKKFMVDNLQSANWLVASLDQRARTILKVATELVKQQDAFFSLGEEHLKPLTLKKIADQIEMHESTVSRVCSNKYLMCERGIFEFKYFLMSGSDGGSGTGSRSVKAKIRNLIENETVDNILSDEKLVRILREQNISIARRTVTKYRESLGLLSSIQRRREKKLSFKK